ncbi:MAG: DUF4136 domain-containing protein [Saprospiraceae bacterium]|nr:DUF4136 domain-containing protein [Saprospiraceae bacterium]
MKPLAYLLLFTLLGCATSNNLNAEFDDSVDFEAYETFVLCVDDFFVENTSYPEYDNLEIRQLIGKEVEKQMINRGHRTNVIKPQLQAGFRILLDHEEVVFTNCDVQTEYGYWKTCTINREVYTTETLVLHVSDIEKNQVIWQAKIDCDFNRSSKALEDYTKEIVETVFNEYPRVSDLAL